MTQEKDNLKFVFGKLSKIAEPVIKNILLDSVDKKFHSLVLYPVLAGGKRLRPVLTLISCRLLGGKLKNALYPAAGIEILHNYTLIVDDLIDRSVLRRGKASLWAKFGKSATECAGVYYAAAIFQAAQRSNNPQKISKIFSRTIKTIVNGEMYDLLLERGGREDDAYPLKNRYKSVSLRDYFDMVGKKTSALLSAACEIGGICAGAKPAQIKALKDFGFNLGIAFQIKDDILDIFGEEKVFGKEIGKDVKERKAGNIVILLALKSLKQKERAALLKILSKRKINQSDVRKAVALIKSTNSRQKAKELAARFIGRSKKALQKLPQNKWRGVLSDLTDFIFTREK